MTPKKLVLTRLTLGERPSASAHAGSQKDQLDGPQISRRGCCSRGECWLAVGLQWVRSLRRVSTTTTPTEITGWVRHTHTHSLWEGWNSPLLHSAQPFTTFRGWMQVCIAMAGVNVNTLMSKGATRRLNLAPTCEIYYRPSLHDWKRKIGFTYSWVL